MKSLEPGVNYPMHQYKLEAEQLESGLAEKALLVLTMNQQCTLVHTNKQVH